MMPPIEPTACDVPDCGNVRCLDCGDRMSCTGPTPVPRCPEHPCCVDCDDGPVYCPECGLTLAEREQDRRADVAYDVARGAL